MKGTRGKLVLHVSLLHLIAIRTSTSFVCTVVGRRTGPVFFHKIIMSKECSGIIHYIIKKSQKESFLLSKVKYLNDSAEFEVPK